MSKKNQNHMQRPAIKPSAIMSAPNEQILYAFNKAKLAFDGMIEFERMIHRLARRCDKIDVLVSVKLDTQKLQDALGGDLRDAIKADYDDIVDVWNDAREYYLNRQERDLGVFGTTYQQGLKKMVDDRLAALDALAKGDDSLIRALPPLDHETDKLLNPVAKSGRKPKPEAWRVTLRQRWLAIESEHPEGIKPNDVRHALFNQVAQWVNGKWIQKADIGDDEKRMFDSLNGSKAKTDTSSYKKWLIGE